MKRIRLLFLVILTSIVGCVYATGSDEDVFNVKSFGAIGDGVALDTKALQDAIDACHSNSGGTVWVPQGRYQIGTLRMKSNVTLSLDYGAHLLASQDLADYDTDLRVAAEGGRTCLIYAEDATNITFQGLGVIDGRGTRKDFPREVNGQRRPRPRLMRLMQCDGVTFSGLTYKNPASWGLHLIECRNLHFDAITIRFRDNNVNNDGIDLDGCENVLIENCDINSGDDAICLKGTTDKLCSNFVVRGCKVSSGTAALKFGTSSCGRFKDIKVTNCYFYDCPQGAIKLLQIDGGILEDVDISRIVMERVGGPIFVRLGNRGRTYETSTGQKYNADVEPEGAPIGSIKNIRISDVVADVTASELAKHGIMITGIPGHAVEDVVLENIKITSPGGGTEKDAKLIVPEDIARYPERHFFGTLPAWGAYIRHARNVVFKNVELQIRTPDQREKVVLVDVEGFVER